MNKVPWAGMGVAGADENSLPGALGLQQDSLRMVGGPDVRLFHTG